MRRLLALLPVVALLGACVESPQAKRDPMRRSTQGFTPRPEARQCLATLGRTRASFEPVADRYLGAGCSTLNAVRLASLSGDDSRLALTSLGPVACPLANAFAGWARFGIDRAARQILGSAVVRIETMGSYNCRNVAGTGRRSAHATAEAIDIAGVVLADGRRISVRDDWHGGDASERRFLRVIQASACKRFGTVLGPQYNAAHHDHIHVELGDTSRSFCR